MFKANDKFAHSAGIVAALADIFSLGGKPNDYEGMSAAEVSAVAWGGVGDSIKGGLSFAQESSVPRRAEATKA